ncbi:MAG: DUF4325 domain-containing protein [Deltaproteobacteria bacterium]|nr:DUF4325 domain-containing protein [Deltaproteobacteria bacterium]
MARLSKRGEEIRQFILKNVENHPKDLVKIASNKFDISRQAINKHIQILVKQKSIQAYGTTRSRQYSLRSVKVLEKSYSLGHNLEEDVVWRNDILLTMDDFPDNVINIWSYCFSEIFNNAIDHSRGKFVAVNVTKTAVTTEIYIYDDGEGIFKKIQRELNLLDESHAVLELSKGKLTTDPSRHTGEGIFFSSRMVDDFIILSGKTYFSHHHTNDIDWIMERQKSQKGTGVFMKMKNNTSKTLKKVFDQFTSGEDYGFNKTVIPVNLVKYGDELLVSRSQAKRLLSRVDRFKTVILDFDGVEAIGQAFADEIFRVFASKNKEIRLVHIKANEDVEQMIVRALSHD